ncbi:hypothetical protein PC9H_007306 [Pleurotus ostreatus]|uniref:Uncharacterized protein n=1 Tax=Pleurotus ostreatus TaxID=5322 RepID=A0A8H7DRE7_PLEOS|nr:uncharacterized protein PC9H_007306 [Pleurotus ostreatus]KAF7428087.1 hypothetical protein PC9H_007306 [Pleurotus ostreatus]KAJ8696146.1 hypothetical protein PTI98_006034 [Pleurotus ostreatus]
MRTCILMPIVAFLNWGAAASALAHPGATEGAVQLDNRGAPDCHLLQDGTLGGARCADTDVPTFKPPGYDEGEPKSDSGDSGDPHRKRQQAQDVAGNSSTPLPEASPPPPPVTVTVPLLTHQHSATCTPSGTTSCTSTRTAEQSIRTPEVSNPLLVPIYHALAPLFGIYGPALDTALDVAINGYEDPSTTTGPPYESRKPTPTAVPNDIKQIPDTQKAETEGKMRMTEEQVKEEQGHASLTAEPSSSTPCSSGSGGPTANPDVTNLPKIRGMKRRE